MTRKDMPRICLNIIVRNEAAVIERHLRSVLPFLHSYAICDTGSTDDTVAIIQSVVGDLPGRIYHDEWVDFGHNRTLALRHGEEVAYENNSEYLMFFDADEQVGYSMSVRPGAGWAWADYGDNYHLQKAKDALAVVAQQARDGVPVLGMVNTSYGSIEYRRAFLAQVQPESTPLDQRWRWVGVRHEYLTCPAGSNNVHIGPELALWVNTDGARSKNPDKFRLDALALKADLEKDPSNTRTVYYMAQSWRDAGERELAAIGFEQRAHMGGWIQERYIAALNAGRMYASFNEAKALQMLHMAVGLLPNRMESLVELAQFYRFRSNWEMSRLWARTAYMAIEENTMDREGLFWSKEDHSYMPVECYYLALYYSGMKQLAKRVLQMFLAEAESPKFSSVPKATVERMRENLRFHT